MGSSLARICSMKPRATRPMRASSAPIAAEPMDGLQHLYAPPTALALARVKDTADPQSRGRVQVTLLATDVNLWATCVVPSAGKSYGVTCTRPRDCGSAVSLTRARASAV